MREQFVTNIENNSPAIAKKWAKLVRESEYTKTYHKVQEDELIKMGKASYDNLGKFLAPQTSRTEIGNFYARLGSKRFEQGFPLCEIHYALHFTKKVLFNYILSEGMLPDTLTLYRVYDFFVEIYDFFDLAVFYITRGFQEALYKKISTLKKIDKDIVNKIFPTGSFYLEMEPSFKTFEKAMEGFNLFKVKRSEL